MKYSLSTAAMILMTSLACGQGQVLQKALMHNGNQREYSLFVPSSYAPDTNTPLVLNLHGFTGNGPQQMRYTGMNSVAEQEGFLVAYPTAVAGDWSDDDPATYGNPSGDYSLSFFDALLDTIQGDYVVDASRVYSTGFSQGGFTSQMLAAARSNTFAAIASVDGVRHFSKGFTEPVDALFPPFIPELPPRPFPLLHIHGTADTIVPFEGGNTVVQGLEFIEFPPVNGVVDTWVANNGCDPVATSSDLPNIFGNDGSTITLFSYGTCDTYTTIDNSENSAEVSFYRVNDGGHDWPVNLANSVIWKFFEQHQLADVSDTKKPGDFDGDGDLDVDDIDQLTVESASGHNNLAFDVTGDEAVNGDDISFWAKHLRTTWIGDANVDGEFNSTDLVNVFQAGHYEDAVDNNSKWSTGDWSGDGEFDSTDFVAAFQDGGYEQVELGTVNAVPEPTSFVIPIVGLIGIAIRGRNAGP